MEARSRADDSAEPKYVIEGQIRESFGRVVYSHKTHEKCADILLKRLSCIKTCQLILSALTTGGFVSALFGTGTFSLVLGSIFSALLLGLNLYTRDQDLGELASKHKSTANDIWLIREKYLSLIADLAVGEKSLDVLQRERDGLAVDLHSVYSTAPSTNSEAYEMAQEAIKNKEEMSFSEEELDAILPPQLRRN